MTEIKTIEGGQKDVSSQKGTTFKKTTFVQDNLHLLEPGGSTSLDVRHFSIRASTQ